MGEKGFEGTEHRSGSLEHAGEDAPRYAIDNPGLPPHRPRLADEDPKAAKRAERQVSVMFLISIVGTVLFFIGYFGVGQIGNGEAFSKIYLQNLLLGLGTALAMFGIGIGVVHWAKTLMPDHETVEDRHEIRSEADRVAATGMISEILDESQIKRRPLLRNTLIGAALLVLGGLAGGFLVVRRWRRRRAERISDLAT